MNFSEIEDVTRLREGDLIVVPSETGRKQKKLHLSPSSFGRLGLSCGFTHRADNSPETVQRLLTHDTGQTRFLFISQVWTDSYEITNSGMLQFCGNRIDEEPLLPKVRYCTFYPLPVGRDATKYARRMFVEYMEASAKRVLSGKIKNSMFFVYRNGDRLNRSGYPPFGRTGTKERNRVSGSLCLSEAYGTQHAREEGTCAGIGRILPAVCNDIDVGADMNSDAIETFLDSEAFRKEHASDSLCGSPVKAPRKFFVAFKERGARFYRPTQKFIDMVAAEAIADMMTEYAENCRRVLADVGHYEAVLKEGVADVKDKIRSSTKLAALIAKKGSQDMISNQLKELTK